MEDGQIILSIYAANNTIVGNYFARAYFSDGSSKDSATVSVSIASYVVLRLGMETWLEFYMMKRKKSAKCGGLLFIQNGKLSSGGMGTIRFNYCGIHRLSGGENTSAAHGFKIFSRALSLAKYFESITCVGD